MKRALILVDIQNDFLPGGALAVPDGDQVIPIANRVMPYFESVVLTQDWHPANHLSFASQHPRSKVGDLIHLGDTPQILWPDHCVQGTVGADFAAGLQTPNHAQIVEKGTNRSVDSYSGFFDNDQNASTGLHRLLAEQDVKQVYILGLATDYCVKFTALDAKRLGYATTLIADGCRGVNLQPTDVSNAMDDMRDAGIEITESAAVCCN